MCKKKRDTCNGHFEVILFQELPWLCELYGSLQYIGITPRRRDTSEVRIYRFSPGYTCGPPLYIDPMATTNVPYIIFEAPLAP